MSEQDIINNLVTVLDFYRRQVDVDGICENGCSCGECESCKEYTEIEELYYAVDEFIV